ncbi:MAG: RNA polymerase sigma factor [bacterium]|nr:RNA polymerase sigma factor [bacterium]
MVGITRPETDKYTIIDIAVKDMKEIKENIYADVENERILIRQAKQGYQPAFTRLISLYQKKVFGLAYKFFQDRDDAMEIVQETFIRLHQKLDGFDENDGKTRFNNWVYRIAYNLCIDYYRKFKKKKAGMKELYEFNEDSRMTSTNPEDDLDRQNFRENLQKAVMKLSKRQKTVFVLRHYSGLKHHEIAETLGLSVGTIKSLYHRAVKSLKKSLVDVKLDEWYDLNIHRDEVG